MTDCGIHMKKNQSIKLEIFSIAGWECLNIVIGKKLSDTYTTHDSTVSLYFTLGQLMDLYYQLDAEIERLGIDA